MKTIQILAGLCALVLTTSLLTQAHASESFDLSKGFQPNGRYSVTLFSSKDGIISELLGYYLAAGAKQRVGGLGSLMYVYPSDNGQSHIIIENSSPSLDLPAFQFNLSLAPEEVSKITMGAGLGADGGTVEFTGPVAQILYQGMESKGLKPLSSDLNGKPKSYAGPKVFCSNGPKGIECTLSFYQKR